ncbi:alpha/beta fold hydrolase [Microbacterium ureisolvens]|uniref:Alpha/beta hydrolase n=1 Tax=Microbacterium ureisolvens TaxID=2781186 RepID=A0ABS7I3T0_9MICO|nr:alpha/beta hydrolase [Microbacterium ureisolvens]MBW9111933.1 alpha/beta hydrolase [Microbacterium ureisolvens]
MALNEHDVPATKPRPAARPASVTRQRVAVGGLAFRVLASASPASREPAIVLVHGIGVSHRYLSRLHDELAGHRTVVSVDLPGFGGLPKPGYDVDVATMARALGQLLEGLALGPVALLGHSMGTQWVVETALQRPELLTSVVAMGPVADARHRTILRQTRALTVDTLLEPPTVNAIVFTDYLRCGVPWYLTQLRHMLTYRLEDRVALLTVPLLLIRGGADPIAGVDWCRHLRHRAPRAELVQIPGHHHVVQHSAPKAVASAILSLTP